MDETELQKMREEMLASGGAASSAFDSFSKALKSGKPDWDAASRGMKGLAFESLDASKKVKTAGEKFKDGFSLATSKLTSGFRSLGQETESGAKAIKNMTDSVGGAISGFAGQFGFVGKAVGGFATAITGATGLALGFVDGLETTNKKLGETGIMFGGLNSGIDEFARVVNDSQLSASILNTVIDKSVDSLRLFSGGSAEGLRKVTGAFNNLKKAGDGQYESLVKLGYSTEDIMEGMADFGATARLAGQDLNMDQLTEGTTKYLKMQRELTRLTGVEVKEAKAKAEALKSDIAFQKLLTEVGTDNAKVLEEILSNTNDSMQPLVKTLLAGGQVTDQQMALLQDALGSDFVEQIRGIGDQARNGIKLDPKVITDQYVDSYKSALKNVNSYIDDLSAASMQTIMNKGGPYADFLALLGPVRRTLEGTNAASEAVNDTAYDVSTGMGKIATALPEVEKASIALRSALFSTGTLLTTVFAPLLTSLAGMVSGGGERLQEMMAKSAEGINRLTALADPNRFTVGQGPHFDFASEEERAAAMAKATAETFGEIAGDGTMFDTLFTSLGTKISDAIHYGFVDAVAEIVPGMTSRSEANEYGQTDTYKALKDAIAQSKSGDAMESTLPAGLMVDLQNYLSAFSGTELDAKMEELGLKMGKIEGFFDFQDHQGLQKKAYGDIINPTVGGQVVRVAEAGMPEIIAPATRGPGGKLGLEVSGAMLDNSRLLQSLAESGKNQVNVMASVSSKMNELVANMEKFARAQEQANRLAS